MSDLVARLRAEFADNPNSNAGEAADRIEELEADIFGCGCPAPYDQCPHDEPLTKAVTRLSTENVELHAEVERLRAKVKEGTMTNWSTTEADLRASVLAGRAADAVRRASSTSRCSRADLLADLNEAINELEASTSPSAADVAERLEAHVERIER